MSDYLSNIQAPDIRCRFSNLWHRTLPYTCGHDLYSDWAEKSIDDPVFGLYRACGFLTRDEAAILYHCALQIGGVWLDIGAHTGWTASHIAMGAKMVVAIDPMFWNLEFYARFATNTKECSTQLCPWAGRSAEFFAIRANCADPSFDGVMIDGDHGWHAPLDDALNAASRLKSPGVIVFHDFQGGPVQEAVMGLLDRGFKARIYLTTHMMAVCWRGDFTPPIHDADPVIVARNLPAQCREHFDWKRVS